MKDILAIHDQRHLNILEHLYYQEQTISFKQVSDYLGIPVRTIHSDVHEMNEYLAPLNVKTSSKGIRLQVPREYSLRYIYKQILENSREFSLLELLFLNETLGIEALADTLFISTSTLKRIINNLNQTLEHEGFQITGPPYHLAGDSKKITQFMSFYFMEKYPNQEYLTDYQKKMIRRLIDSVIGTTGKTYDITHEKRISCWVFINGTRLKYEHPIPVTASRVPLPTLLNDASFCQEYLESFGVTLNPEAIQQLFYVFNNLDYAFDYEDLVKVIASSKSVSQTYSEIHTLLTTFAKDFEVPLPEASYESVMLALVNTIHLRANRTIILYDRREYFWQQLSGHYTNIRQLLASYFSRFLSFPLSKGELNEFSYILITHWSELFQQLRKTNLTLNLYILVDTDVEHGTLIQKELETYSRFNLAIHAIKQGDTQALKNLKPTDILLTTIPGLTDLACSVVCFSDYLSAQDYEDLDQLLKEAFSASQE